MAEIAVAGAAAGMVLAGFVGWYGRWRRRVASALERVPVHPDRPALVHRRGSGPLGDSH